MRESGKPKRAPAQPVASRANRRTGHAALDSQKSRARKTGAPQGNSALSVEAEEILSAIRNDRVDALVIKTETSERVMALRSFDELQRADIALKNLGMDHWQADAARREMVRRFETLAIHAPVGIFMNDDAGNCVYVNPRCCEILGLSKKDALGQGLVNAIHPNDRNRELRAREQAMAANTVREAEYRFRSPNGKSVWVKTRSSPLDGEGGQSRTRIGTITDITELKRTENALRESTQQLQKLLDERERLTQDLHDGCIQSIYAIGLNLQASRQLLNDHPEAASTIGACAASLNLVIQELRSFISGHGTSIIAGHDLQREIEHAIQAGGNQGTAFAIEIDAVVADALAPDVASHLLHIAREAISNASRHAHARSGCVSLRVHDGFIRLEISDDGIGFDPQRLETSGLGLHHINARARKLGGRSNIVSTPNNGTCIVVQVPITR